MARRQPAMRVGGVLICEARNGVLRVTKKV